VSTITRLVSLASPYKWWLLGAVLLSFGTLGASVGLMAASAYLISKAALVTAFADLAVIVTAVRFFAISRAALRYAERYVTHLTTFRILTRLRVWFYSAIEPLAPARLQAYHSADLYTRINSDIETLENFYVRVVLPPLAAALTIALTCIILGAFGWQLAVALLGFAVLTGVILPWVTQHLARTPGQEWVTTRAELNAVATDQIQGMADLLAFGREAEYAARIEQLGGALDAAQLRLAHLRGWSSALAVLFAGLAGLTVLLLAIPLVTGGQMEGVFLALVPLTAIAAFEALQPLGVALQQMQVSKASAKRLFELIDAQPLRDPAEPYALPTQHSIEFRDVTFAYAPGEPDALHKVSFRVPAGTCYALVGASGAGKSTIVNLLARFWEVNSGAVMLGGRDVRDYRQQDLRAELGVVSQQTYLFSGTLRDNLLLAKGDATDAEITAACRVAQMDLFLASLPNGLDTLVGQNGMKLSGGERQRIAIARVVLKNAPILILDEATANLDVVTERELFAALEPFMQGRTTLVISHRQAGLERAERTLMLQAGHLVSEPVSLPTHLPAMLAAS